MTKRRAFKLFSSLVVLIILAAGYVGQQLLHKASPTTVVTPGYYQVTHFVDGDTIDVSMNGKTETVRFIGVDTPETHKPNTPVQCYGPQASDFTRQTIGNQTVRLEADPADDNRDRYGRLLRYVYLPDGTLLDQKLIEQGYGFAYISFPFGKKSQFEAAQTTAQNAKKGLWGICQPYQESDGRWQSNNAT